MEKDLNNCSNKCFNEVPILLLVPINFIKSHSMTLNVGNYIFINTIKFYLWYFGDKCTFWIFFSISG